jgi:hypothetical protein
MDMLLKLIIVSVIVLLALTLFNNNVHLSFAKDQAKNGFVSKKNNSNMLCLGA